MRHKNKKEALDDIVQKMVNDYSGEHLEDLLRIADAVQIEKRTHGHVSFESSEIKKILNEMDWLYGYENEIQNAFEYFKAKFEKKIFSKESSHVTIVSCVVYFCTIARILSPCCDDGTNWENMLEQSNNNKKLSDCLEILKRYCPEKIDVPGFFEARRYMRIWDSEFNW